MTLISVRSIPLATSISPAIIRRRPCRYDTDNTLENLTVKAATGENSGQLAQRLHELVDSSGNQRKTPILNHLLIGFPEQCDCLSNFTTIASKTIKCQTSATRRYTQYYYFFLYAPYKSDTGVFSNIWISFLCALCSLKISARLLPPKAVPIPVAAAESNVNCGMASEAIPNVAVPAKINPDEIFFSLNS